MNSRAVFRPAVWVLSAFLAGALQASNTPVLPSIDWTVNFSRTVQGDDTLMQAFALPAGDTMVVVRPNGSPPYRIVRYDSAGSISSDVFLNDKTFTSFQRFAVDAAGNLYGAIQTTVSSTYRVKVFKFDTAGNLVWSRTSVNTGFTNRYYQVYDLTLDSGGNIVVGGYQYDYNFNPVQYDMLASKFDPTGTPLWTRTASCGSSFNICTRVSSDASNNIYLAGYSYTVTGASNWYPSVSKMDSAGDMVWSRTASSIASIQAYDTVARAGNNAVYVRVGNNTPRLTALDAATGDCLGSTTFVISGGFPNSVSGLSLDSANNIVVLMVYYWPSFGNYFPTLVKYDPAFNTIAGWPKRAVPPTTLYSVIGGLDSSDNLSFAAPFSSCCPSNQDLAVVRTDTVFSAQWTKVIADAVTTGQEYAGHVVANGAGREFITGTSGSRAFLGAFDATGAIQWSDAMSNTTYGNTSDMGLGLVGPNPVHVVNGSMPAYSGASGVALLSYDVNGTFISATEYSQVGESNYYPGAAVFDGSGNAYVAAYRYSFDALMYEPHMVKLSPTGIELWRSTSYLDAFYEVPTAAAVDGAGNSFLVARRSYAETWIVAFDPAGVMLWSRSFSGQEPTQYRYALAAGVGAVYAAGYESGGSSDGIVEKLDAATGTLQWSRTAEYYALFYGTQIDGEGNLQLTGYGYEPTYGWGEVVHAYDANGTLLYRMPLAVGQYGHGIAAGSYYVVGDDNGGQNLHLTRLTENPLRASLSMSPRQVPVNGTVTLVLTVTNTRGNTVTSMVPHLDANQGTGALGSPAGPSPAGPVTLNAHASQSFTWSYTALSPSVLEFTATVTGINSENGGAVVMDASVLGASDVKANLEASLSLSATVAYVGQWMTASLTVTNTGDGSATGLVPSVQVGPGASLITLVGGPEPASLDDLAPGSATTFSWTYSVSGDGPLALTATVQGYAGIFGVIASPAAVAPGLLLRPARLVSMQLAPVRVSVGQAFRIALSVTNTGQAPASGVQYFLQANAGGVHLTPTTSVAGPMTLAGGSTTTFEWDFIAASAGAVAFTLSVQGTDSGTGAALALASSGSLYIQAPANLAATTAVSANTLRTGSAVLVAVTVTNTGEADAVAVLFPSSAGPSAPVLTAQLGPIPPGVAVLPGGASVTSVWSYQGVSSGVADFTVTVTGSDGNAGTPLLVATTSSTIGVVGRPNLSAVVTTPSAPVKAGRGYDVTVTVLNNGTGPATGVGTGVVIGDPAKSIFDGGVSPAGSVALGIGASTAFTWRLKATGAGLLTLTGSVTGFDPADGSAIGASGQANVTVLAAIDVPSAVFPNPVAGDVMNLALDLEGDATSVEVNVYNAAFKRVYQRTWKQVLAADPPLSIEGVKAWAPGIYLIRVHATLAAGGEKEFPVVKVKVKR